MAAAAFGLSACYVYSPLYSAPAPGTQVELELNDRGRVALEEHVGPEVAKVQGVIGATADSQFVVRVTEVQGLYGSRSRWALEPVVFRPEYLRGMRERRYSKVRTYVLGTVLASATVAFMVTRGLLIGGGTEDEGGGPPIPPPDDQ